jgi:tape measure domain-containing protein
MGQESYLRIVIDSRNAERNARNIANELQNIERNGNYATRSMDSMSVATRSLVGYMGGLVTIGAAVNKMDAWTGLQNRLKLVTDSQAELTTAMNDTFAIAQKTASSWDSVAMVYQRFADNADRLGISMKQTAALTETVSKAISVSGGSAASAEAALMQFGQALASGVLRGEEFNSIAEQAPGLLKAIAFGLDTNVGSLRAMAADGKITGDILVESLSKAKPYIDDLFNKTDFTISQSFTKLSNEVTKFVGEAGSGSGSAKALSESISGLANNLSLIADIAVVGGVALLTKTILTQTVAIQGSIAASVARRAADTAVLQSQVQLAALEVQRTRQIAAQAISEIGLARQELNSATTRTARAAATVRLTQAEIAHRVALNQTTAAIATNTAAQNALNASRAIGTRMLALVGGPIGVITLGVAGLAAGYMYLKNRTAEANAKLEEQGKVALETDENLKKLSGNDKISAVQNLTAAFDDQNKKLAESKESVDAVLFAIRAASVENEKARKVTEDAKNGIISYDEAIKRLNNMDIPTDLYDMLKKQVIQYDENAEKAGNSQRALSALGKVVQLAGNLFQNSAVQVAKNTDELDKNETAAQKAARAQKEYVESLSGRAFDAQFTKTLLANNLTEGQTNALLEAANYARKKGVEFTKAMAQEALRVYNLEKANKDTIDAKNEAERKLTKEKEKQSKESEKQLKLGQRLIGISGNSGIGTGAHLDVRYGGSRDGQKVSKEHLARLQAGGKSLSNYRVSSDYGSRKAPTKGASSFHKGIDFAMPVGTPITTKVAVKDVKTAYDPNGGGYYSTVTFEDGVVLKLLHQSPSMQGKVKGGASDGTLKSNQDIERQAEQQANTQIQLQMAVATERKRIETQLQEDIKEINKAGFSPEETKRLTAEYQARADNDIAIANYALKTKLDDYEAFKKTESELLKQSFDEKKFYAARDLELSKEDRSKAVALLDEQLKQEQALLMLAKETRLFQYREALMVEAEFVRERYRIEMLELSKIVDIEERRIAMQAKTTAFIRGNLAPVGTPIIEADKGKSNTQLLQEETGRELLAMQNRHLAAQLAAKDNADKLLQIESDYIRAKEDLHAQHDIKLIDARQADYENQLQVYSQIAGMTAQTFDQMTGMLRESVGESNALYKTMFLAGRAASIAQAIVNTEEGATKALAQGGAYGSLLAGVVRATGYASVGLIAGQTIAGYKSGGYTGNYGTTDVAGVVHGQEYVLNAAATKRVGIGTLDAINSGRSLGEKATVVQPQVNVVVENHTSSQVQTRVDDEGRIRVIVRDEIDTYVPRRINESNSKIRKAMERSTTATAKRA